MPVMCRDAEDDNTVCWVANAMESAGATVFSVTFVSAGDDAGGDKMSSRFIVWAKVASNGMIDTVDNAVDEALAA